MPRRRFLFASACATTPQFLLIGSLLVGILGCTEPELEEPITDEPCYRGLPDLNGDGSLDETDCDLRGVGAAIRQLCLGDPGAWVENAACRGTKNGEALQIPGDVVWVNAYAVNSKSVFVVQTPTTAWTWFDENGNDIPDATGEQFPLTGVSDPRVVAIFSVGFPHELVVGTRSHIWRDRNRNGRIDFAELIAASMIVGSERVVSDATVSFRDDVITAAFQVDLDTSPSIVAWADLNKNWLVEPAEVVEISGRSLVGFLNLTNTYGLVFRDLSHQQQTWTSEDWTVLPHEIRSGGHGECVSALTMSIFSYYYTCNGYGGVIFGMPGRIFTMVLDRRGEIGFTAGLLTAGQTVPLLACAGHSRRCGSTWT